MAWLNLEEDLAEEFGKTGVDRVDLRNLPSRRQWAGPRAEPKTQAERDKAYRARRGYDPEARRRTYLNNAEKKKALAKAYYQAHRIDYSNKRKAKYQERKQANETH